MAIEICKYIILVLAVFNFGFMLFDGTRAFVKGDYVRPTKGDYAGQLGPWSKLVQKLGIDPLSSLMKGIFILWGITGLSITLYFGLYPVQGWYAMLTVNILSLWYLWAGTMSGLIQVILLVVMRYL